MVYDLGPQLQDLRLLLGGHKRPHRAFYRAHKGLHKAALIHKLKGHILNRSLVLVEYRIQKHGREIHIGLVLRYCLEFQFHRPVLVRYLFVDLLYDGDTHIKPRPHNALELAKDSDHGHIALLHRHKTQENDKQYNT